MDSLVMAKAYEEMSNSLAFRDFIQWCDDKVEQAELKLATLTPEQMKESPAYLQAWQERKKWNVELKLRIEECKAINKELHERPSADNGDPTPISTYSDIRGY